MDFAKKILGKYGWKEGEGLGKNNNGIANPLKVNLKFDNAGLGVDRATEFNDHWWERCFNEAAKNVEVQTQVDGKVSTARKDGQEAVEISTKSYSTKKLKKAKERREKRGGVVYENFLPSATLTNGGGEISHIDSIKTDEIAVATVNVLSDEELFRACGGRTAHKGARHGLKLSGKLARLEQQDREMLEKMQQKGISADNIDTPKFKKDTLGKLNKKTEKPKKRDAEIDVAARETSPVLKKKKKKRNHSD